MSARGRSTTGRGEGEVALFEEDCLALSPLPEAPFDPVGHARLVADECGNVTLGRHRHSSDPSLALCYCQHK